MLNFIKRNLKFVIVVGVSFLLIVGLTTALILTNVGTGHARGRDRDRDRNHVRVELTQEQIAERVESRRERLEQRLADGRITQEEYDARIAAIESGEYPAGDRVRSGSRSRSENGEGRSERTPLTEEQIAERVEKLRERLAQELADGNITQAEYNEKLEAIENGEFRGLGRSRGNKSENSEGTGTTTNATTTNTTANTTVTTT